MGTLQITVLPYAEVFEGAASLGRAIATNLTLPAGRHRLRLVHPDYEPLNRVVNVPENKTIALTVDWAEVGIRRKTP